MLQHQPQVCNIIISNNDDYIIKDSIESCFSQTFKNMSVVVVSRMSSVDQTYFNAKGCMDVVDDYSPTNIVGSRLGKKMVITRLVDKDENACLVHAFNTCMFYKIRPQYFLIMTSPCVLDNNVTELCYNELKNEAIACYADTIDSNIYIPSQSCLNSPIASIGPFIFIKADAIKAFNPEQHKTCLDFINQLAISNVVSHLPKPMSKILWTENTLKLAKIMNKRV